MREFHRVLRGPDYARRLVGPRRGRRCRPDPSRRPASSGIAARSEACALSTPRRPPRSSAARRVLLATGVREASRAARFIGGQRPRGIVSTGALQSMVYLAGKRPFTVPGHSGQRSWSPSPPSSPAATPASVPLAMVEAARPRSRRAASPPPCRACFGIPLLSRALTLVSAFTAGTQVEGVTLRERRRHDSVRSGDRRRHRQRRLHAGGDALLRLGHLDARCQGTMGAAAGR